MVRHLGRPCLLRPSDDAHAGSFARYSEQKHPGTIHVNCLLSLMPGDELTGSICLESDLGVCSHQKINTSFSRRPCSLAAVSSLLDRTYGKVHPATLSCPGGNMRIRSTSSFMKQCSLEPKDLEFIEQLRWLSP